MNGDVGAGEATSGAEGVIVAGEQDQALVAGVLQNRTCKKRALAGIGRTVFDHDATLGNAVGDEQGFDGFASASPGEQDGAEVSPAPCMDSIKGSPIAVQSESLLQMVIRGT